MTIVAGKQIAAEIYAETKARVAALDEAPKLAIITCAPNFETTKYLELKRRKATELGIKFTIIEVPVTASTAELVQSVSTIGPHVDGIVVQLPLPSHVDREAVLAAVAPSKDPDCFSGAAPVLSPVIGAIAEIAERHGLDWAGKEVAVFGHGRLVGAPAARFAREQGASVTVLTEESPAAAKTLETADVIIAGAGQPQAITPAMVKEGVYIFDAATSEADGELRGDVAPAVAEKAALFTPVPGGIGPITVAILLRNLVTLYEHSRSAKNMV